MTTNTEFNSNETYSRRDAISFFAKALGVATMLPAYKTIDSVFSGNEAYAQDDNESLKEIALETLVKGNDLWINKNYDQAIPILKEAKLLYEQLPIKERSGNYGATLTGLAGSIVHSNIRKEKINRVELIEAKGLLLDAIEDYKLCEVYLPESKQECIKFSTGAYNLLGITEKYLGNTQNAKEAYLKSLEADPNNSDAKFNLKNLYN
jgi:tetratricopeptide (TPR) repeat protein